MPKRKNGEQEAITILEGLGIEIDKDYYDDNSHKSMPDIRCKDGRFIEVTHTYHNNEIPKKISKFDQLQPGENWNDNSRRRLAAEEECGRALDRIRNLDYEKDDQFSLTPAGQAQFKKDAKLIKEHLGYDVTKRDPYEQHSEFKCDHPSISFSTDNILREITGDKARKYPNGDVDLFIFAADEEFRLMKELLAQIRWNGAASEFRNKVLLSPFPKIYVCEWCFETQEYNTVDPQLAVFHKMNGSVIIDCHNVN